MAVSQQERRFAISSPLGDDVLLFHRMTGEERLGQLFRYDVEIMSENLNVALDDVLGQNITVRYDLPEQDKTRYFNGFVSQFHFEGVSGSFARYRAELRPWLWFLTRAHDCRIFQDKSVPDIISQIFGDYGFTDFENRLTGDHASWEYCVQYQESDYAFISRLMEQEGIYHFCEHEDGRHTVVLADSAGGHSRIEGYEQVPFYPPEGNIRERDHLNEWRVIKNVRSGKFVHRAFDFERPRVSLESRRNNPQGNEHNEYEVYRYPGQYLESGAGDNLATIRLEELQWPHERVEGSGDAGGLFAGGMFELTEYPRSDQNREYLIVGSRISLTSDAYSSGSEGGGSECHSHVVAIDSRTQFRPPRVTPKARVDGPQTAMVVGPSGEEIYTDRHGRVKVQFHWDREGNNNEESSCWIRCSHPWAGRNWGAIYIPRIGHEVIVDFLDGDMNQPVITGRLYNGDARPPYDLPNDKEISGVKSDSTKGGGGYNEFIMDDTTGEELIRVHAQFDMDSTVENDLREHVINNRTRNVDVDELVEIGGNQTVDVAVNQDVVVGSNQTNDVGANLTETVGGSDSRTITGSKSESITGSLSQTVTGGITVDTPASMTVTAMGGFTVMAPGGVRNVDSFFDSMGGVDSSTYGMTTSSTMVAINLIGGLEMSSKNVVIEGVTAKLETVYMTYALKALDTSTVAIKIENDSLNLNWGFHIIS